MFAALGKFLRRERVTVHAVPERERVTVHAVPERERVTVHAVPERERVTVPASRQRRWESRNPDKVRVSNRERVRRFRARRRAAAPVAGPGRS
jgi:hypothetical protein